MKKYVEKIDRWKTAKALTYLGNFLKNRPAVGATVAAMAMFLGMNSATTAIAIMFAIYFGMAELSGVVAAVGFVPMLFFLPFIKKIVAKWGKKESSRGCQVVSGSRRARTYRSAILPWKVLPIRRRCGKEVR